MFPTLLLIRHAETAYNEQGQKRVKGAMDLPVHEGALARFEPYAKRLLAKYPLAAMAVSPLERTRETAYVLHRLNREPVRAAIEQGLCPWNRGALQGRPIADVKPELDRLVDEPDRVPYGGESFNTFVGRFIPTLRRLLKQAGACRERGALGVVCHSGDQGVAMAWHDAGLVGQRLHQATLANMHNHTRPGHALVWQHRGGRWMVEEFA